MDRRASARLFTGLMLLFLSACGTVLQAAGYPPEAMRRTAPEGIEERAPSVGAMAPAVELRSHEGERYSLDTARTKGPVVVLFYRGHW